MSLPMLTGAFIVFILGLIIGEDSGYSKGYIDARKKEELNGKQKSCSKCRK